MVRQIVVLHFINLKRARSFISRSPSGLGLIMVHFILCGLSLIIRKSEVAFFLAFVDFFIKETLPVKQFGSREYKTWHFNSPNSNISRLRGHAPEPSRISCLGVPVRLFNSSISYFKMLPKTLWLYRLSSAYVPPWGEIYELRLVKRWKIWIEHATNTRQACPLRTKSIWFEREPGEH